MESFVLASDSFLRGADYPFDSWSPYFHDALAHSAHFLSPTDPMRSLLRHGPVGKSRLAPRFSHPELDWSHHLLDLPDCYAIRNGDWVESFEH